MLQTDQGEKIMSKLIKSTALSGKTIVAFGDSLTNFCGNSYASHIAEDLDVTVINAGVGGNNTYHARERFEADVLAHKPDLVIIGFAGNDQAVKRDDRKSIVPIEEFRANLLYFLESIRAQGGDVVFFTVTPTMPERYTPWEYNIHYIYEDGAVLDRYCDCIRDLAREYGCGLVDIHREYDLIPLDDYMLGDGMHPSDLGRRFLADLVGSYLLARYDNVNKAEMTVNCVDESGKILKSDKLIGAIGAHIAIPSPAIDGKTALSDITNATFENGKVIEILYK